MNKIALIGNYPPRKCGIATFTHDLNEGMKANGVQTAVLAINDGLNNYNYPSDVAFEIEQNDISSYINAAEFLHTNKFDAVILQHEFGIFGGKDGKHIIQLLKRLRMPVITTMHTILDDPSENQRKVVSELGRLSRKIVSISAKGLDLLNDVYSIPKSKTVHIHHGVHEIENLDVTGLKKKLGVENKKVILTFGLLSKNKSIEVVINALPEVIKKHPDTVYIVLGATHPHVLKHEGEDYRHSLIRLVKKHGLEKNVLFVNRFVSNEELFSYLKMCDIYVIPYLGEKQISSGTLIYTMGAAKPIISTPFWYATEMLADNRGVLFDFKDSVQLADRINELLENDSKRETIAQNALALAKECYWPNVGKQYYDLSSKMVSEEGVVKTEYELADESELKFTYPPLKLNHLQLMTDNTGILQHARYSIPNRSHGYCTDDNARALLLTVMLENDVQNVDELNRLTSIYLSYLDYAYNADKGKFRNFMSYSREWLDEAGTDDSNGRAIWALGYVAANTKVTGFYHHSDSLFKMGLKAVEDIYHPRSLAYSILGLTHHSLVHGENEVIELLKKKAEQLFSTFDKTIDNEWLWHDEKVSYGNSRVPQAMIFSGWYLKDEKMALRGLKILDWLIEKQFRGNIFSPIGNNGWLTPKNKAQFDQQPLEANGMIDACLQAESYTGDDKYGSYALKALDWFTGDNDINVPVYDFSTGGSHDGVMANGINMNEGAESTISWLMSLQNISLYLRETKKINL